MFICTAISFLTKDHYFGRNLDLDHCYDESVIVVPRKYPLTFRCQSTITTHYAMIGIGIIVDNYPLYYDATNEHGLSIAGLNFPGNARYLPQEPQKDNIAPFEFIPWILCQCSDVDEAKTLLTKMNIAEIPFNTQYALTPLHWMISDSAQSITVESTERGLQIYENPIGVLTNNPEFPFHLHNLTNHLNLTREIPSNRFSDKVQLIPDSLGMGAIGLPGDLSSASRFVRAAFTKLNSVNDCDELSSVSQFFHILASVAQTNGCCRTENGFEKTIYSSCCNTDKGIYYYKTYENQQIVGVRMNGFNLERNCLYPLPLEKNQNIHFAN